MSHKNLRSPVRSLILSQLSIPVILGKLEEGREGVYSKEGGLAIVYKLRKMKNQKYSRNVYA